MTIGPLYLMCHTHHLDRFILVIQPWLATTVMSAGDGYCSHWELGKEMPSLCTCVLSAVCSKVRMILLL